MPLPYVITLSSIPPRFGLLGPTLDALLAQKARPEAVTLYIPHRYRRFPDWDGTLPEVPKGVTIRRTEEDLGPATKVLFAAEELKGESIRILFCDDDRIYKPEWSRQLLAAARWRPRRAIVATGSNLDQFGLEQPVNGPRPRFGPRGKRSDWPYQIARLRQSIAYGGPSKVPPEKKAPRSLTHRSGYIDIGEGYGGVLVQPHYFPPEAWHIPPVLWTVDDVWLSGHLTRNGVPIWLARSSQPVSTQAYRPVEPLNTAIIDNADRAQADLACIHYMRDTYGIWKD